MLYVIAGYVDDDDGTLYWSNEGGWVTLPSASVFTDSERVQSNLPLGDEARWVELPVKVNL